MWAPLGDWTRCENLTWSTEACEQKLPCRRFYFLADRAVIIENITTFLVMAARTKAVIALRTLPSGVVKRADSIAFMRVTRTKALNHVARAWERLLIAAHRGKTPLRKNPRIQRMLSSFTIGSISISATAAPLDRVFNGGAQDTEGANGVPGATSARQVAAPDP